MLFMLVSVTLLGLFLCGAGCLFGRVTGFNSARNLWIYFWLGFFVISTLSMFVSLFVPVNLISLIVFCIIGITGLPFFYRCYNQSMLQYSAAEIKIFKYIVFFALAVITCKAAQRNWMGWVDSIDFWPSDTDGYHAQIIRWYNEYGTPPGLGNLQERLAFNSSWHSLAALFDNGIWDARSAWIMPALSMLGGIFYFVYELIFARHNGVRLYALCILIWLYFRVQAGFALPSLYYDEPVHVLNAVIILEAYYLISGPVKKFSDKALGDAANILMLSVGAFMIKPIGAVTLLFSGMLTLFLLIRNKKWSVFPWLKIYLPSFCAFGIWIGKNIMLSGYIMYPLPFFALPLDWTMTFELAKANYVAVLGWARMPGSGYRQSLENGFWFWFKPWLGRNLRNTEFFNLVILRFPFSVFLWFLAVRLTKSKKAVYFFLWNLASIGYWFITAPDLRFGSGFFWICLASVFLFLIPSGPFVDLSRCWQNKTVRLIVLCAWGLGILAGQIGPVAFSYSRSLFSIGKIPAHQVIEYTVPSDPPFSVWLPAENSNRSIGNSALPSAHFKPSNLEMREPGNLGKGFRPVKR